MGSPLIILPRSDALWVPNGDYAFTITEVFLFSPKLHSPHARVTDVIWLVAWQRFPIEFPLSLVAVMCWAKWTSTASTAAYSIWRHTNCVSPVTPLTLYSSIDKNVRCVAWLLQLNLTSIGAWSTRSPTPWKFGSDQLFIGSRQPKNQSVRLGSLLTSSVTYVYIWHLLDLPVQINFDRITSDHITT